ncbi:MAG: branched-chain amino acid ABC transporter permease [Pseudomonadota bacterium]
MSFFPSGLEAILQAVATGLLVGSTYGLMCVALGLIFGIMRLINFAQGDFLMLGMYFALAILSGLGLGAAIGSLPALILAALAAVPVFFAVGWLMHAAVLGRIGRDRPGMTEGEMHQTQLITTLGISLVLSNGGLMLFGSTPVSLNTPLASQALVLEAFKGDVMVFLNEARILAAVAALAASLGLYALLHRTDIGKKLRAAADNPLAATYMGIDVARCHRFTFGLGFGLTALAGAMVATYYPFQPYVGLDFVIVMYAGVVLGGLGSIMGSFWGGLVIGLVQQLSTLVLPMQLQGTTVFVVFLLIMLIRPQGLFGRSVERA